MDGHVSLLEVPGRERKSTMQPQRKLLIVTYHFPPSAAVATFRMLGFARHLPRFGWQVGVVAPPRVPDEPVDEALVQRVPAETTVFSVPYPDSWPVRHVRRFLFNGVWLPRALPAVVRAVKQFRPDVVLTSGPPHCVHFLGMFLKRYYGMPWLATLRDPWYTNCPPEYGWFPGPRWQRFWERRMVQQADGVIANTPRCCAGLQAAYPAQRQRIDFVTNGFDPEFFPPPAPLMPVQTQLTVLHAGELYCGRNPGPFFDAVKAVEQTRTSAQVPVKVRLLGRFTEDRFDPLPAFKQRGLEHLVEIGGQVPYAEALQAMTRAHILLLIDTPGKKFSIPAKLFEYLGAARPILALCEQDSDVAWALKTGGIDHRVVSPLNVSAIQRALVELRDGWQSGTLTASIDQRLATFTRASVAKKLAGLLDRAVARNRPVHSSAAAHDAPDQS
jgi:glycosyltransferase involved in cell wall biosynthesis